MIEMKKRNKNKEITNTHLQQTDEKNRNKDVSVIVDSEGLAAAAASSGEPSAMASKNYSASQKTKNQKSEVADFLLNMKNHIIENKVSVENVPDSASPGSLKKISTDTNVPDTYVPLAQNSDSHVNIIESTLTDVRDRSVDQSRNIFCVDEVPTNTKNDITCIPVQTNNLNDDKIFILL